MEIFTDCKSLVDKLCSSNILRKINNILVEILMLHRLMLKNNKNLEIVWIKGHFEIKSNEIVDMLAKAIITTQVHEQYIVTLI